MGGSAILLVMLQCAMYACNTIQTPGEEEPVLVTSSSEQHWGIHGASGGSTTLTMCLLTN